MFGITIRTSEPAQPFWQLVERTSTFEKKPSVSSLNYPHHVTLSRYEKIHANPLLKGLRVLQDLGRVILSFDWICIFESEHSVLWLAPRIETM